MIFIKWFSVLVIVGALFMYPARAYVCDSIICIGDWFGYTDIAKRDAEKQEKVAQVEADKEQRLKTLDAQISAATSAAANDLERIKNARYESDNQRAIAIRQAEVAFDAYKAQWSDWKAVQVKQLDAQISASTDQANIAQAGIHESGQTQRSALAWDSSYNMVTILILGVIIIYFVHRRTGQPTLPTPPTVVLMVDRQNLLNQADQSAGYRVIDQEKALLAHEQDAVRKGERS